MCKKKVLCVFIIFACIVSIGVGILVKMNVKDKKEEKSKVDQTLSFKPVKNPKEEYIKLYGEDNYQFAQFWIKQTFRMTRVPVKEDNIIPLKKKYHFEDVVIKSSRDGHKIPADYFLTDNNKDCNTLIVVHGINCNRRTNVGIEELFLEQGYNVLAFDQSGAGENESSSVTFGGCEHFDLLDCINYVRKEMGKDKKLVLFGYSYGGGVTGASLGYEEIDKQVDYAILDCPISDIKDLIMFQFRRFVNDKQDEIFESIDRYVRLHYGFTIDQMSAKCMIQNTDTPVLIFTSLADEIIPAYDVRKIYDAIKSDKKYLHIFKTVPHTCALISDEKADFIDLINKFINDKLEYKNE